MGPYNTPYAFEMFGKISTIKMLRDAIGIDRIGLKEAKDFVESEEVTALGWSRWRPNGYEFVWERDTVNQLIELYKSRNAAKLKVMVDIRTAFSLFTDGDSMSCGNIDVLKQRVMTAVRG